MPQQFPQQQLQQQFQGYKKPNHKFNPYLLGVLIGIALAIIFLLLYKLVYLHFLGAKASPSSNSPHNAELQAEIEWYTAALAAGPCQGAVREDIPTIVDDVSDLYGCWVNESHYVDPETGSWYYYRFCFDQSGNAQNYAADKNSQGEIMTECALSSTAVMHGENFTVTKHGNCPGWIKTVTVCRLKSPGIARCTLSSPDRPDMHMDFFYRGVPR
jgi:hypothetical protein